MKLKTKLGILLISISSVMLYVGCSSSDSSISAPEENGTLIDSRDEKKYKTVKIGDQIWMAENLNYETNDSYCYNDSIENCKKYGRLYTWEASLNACPGGWHLPTKEEVEDLLEYIGGQEIAGKMLKSTTGWAEYYGENGNGVDAFGFNAIPAGDRYDDSSFNYAGKYANFWSTTEDGEYYAYSWYLSYADEEADLLDYYKGPAYSVRCLRDSN